MRSSTRLSLLCAGAILFSAFTARSQDREISVKGSAEFKVKIAGDTITLKGATLEGKQLKTEAGHWTISQGGKDLFAITHTPNGEIRLTRDGSPAYTVRTGTEGYSIFAPDNTLLQRVKIKSDKFNLYDSSANRLLHGKEKEDGFGVKNENGDQILKIKGVKTLREASWFALEIAPEFQIILWADSTLK